MAMPEVRIGLIRDVGGITCCRAHRAWAARRDTGRRYRGKDAIARVRDHYGRHDKLDAWTPKHRADGVESAIAAHAVRQRQPEAGRAEGLDRPCYAGHRRRHTSPQLRGHDAGPQTDAANLIRTALHRAVGQWRPCARRKARHAGTEESPPWAYKTGSAVGPPGCASLPARARTVLGCSNGGVVVNRRARELR